MGNQALGYTLKYIDQKLWYDFQRKITGANVHAMADVSSVIAACNKLIELAYLSGNIVLADKHTEELHRRERLIRRYIFNNNWKQFLTEWKEDKPTDDTRKNSKTNQ